MPKIGIIMGSLSDFETMRAAVDTVREFGVEAEVFVVSAHRTPDRMSDYAKSAKGKGLKVIIAGAGGAAHLPGMVASLTSLPVIGVPVQTKALQGLDSLYSILQMPAGVPVATVGIGNARNGALLALRILAIEDPNLSQALERFSAEQVELVAGMNDELDLRCALSELD